jgi:ubiquinone/menaquinone biosynthesis C-methylase UbiE
MTTRATEVIEKKVQDHYHIPSLQNIISEAFASTGKPLADLDYNDLGAVDEFHIRGRASTAELAELAAITRESRVLDVGSGIGGTARYLASHFQCQVTGVDLTESFCRTANELSALVGLDQKTNFIQGSATDLPFHTETFGVVWTEHVQMNIADKERFYFELARVLQPGGILAFHDIFLGEHGQPYCPAPWASARELSELCSPETADEILEELGMQKVAWVETTQKSSDWFAEIAIRLEDSKPPLGVHLLMGDSAVLKLQNCARSFREGRARTVQAVFRKP